MNPREQALLPTNLWLQEKKKDCDNLLEKDQKAITTKINPENKAFKIHLLESLGVGPKLKEAFQSKYS